MPGSWRSIRIRSGEASAASRTPSSPDGRLDHLVAGELEHVPDQLQVLGVVLDDEDRVRRSCARPCDRCSSVRGVPVRAIRQNATVVSAASRSSRLTGFTRYAAAPSAAPRARSSTIETTMTGMSRVSGSALSASQHRPAVDARAAGCRAARRRGAPAGPRRDRTGPSRAVGDVGGHPGQVGGQQVERRTVVLDHDDLAHEAAPRRTRRAARRRRARAPGSRSRTCCRRRPRSRATSGRRAARPGAGEGEAEAGALLARAAAPALLEGLEDPLAVRLGHPDAGVGHGDVDVRAAPRGPGRRRSRRRR